MFRRETILMLNKYVWLRFIRKIHIENIPEIVLYMLIVVEAS